MGVDAMRIRVQVRNILVVSSRTCYRSVCKHPFLVGTVCFLIFMYRSFPFLISLLVSASPVLVCTAILLGTLLSFGEPNIPEIEKEREDEEEVSHEISSLEVSGAAEDPTVVVNDRDKSFYVDRFSGRRKDIGDRAVKEDSLQQNGVNKIEDDDGLGDYMPLIDENSREIHSESEAFDGVERAFHDFELQQKREICKEKLGTKEVLSQGEAVEKHYSPLQSVGDENIKIEDNNSPGAFIESQKGDDLNFLPDSSWKRAKDENEEEEEDEGASDSGSDGGESSSPDASMEDIIPMLDELHPLLDEEAPKPTHMSHNVSDAGSELSHNSNESSLESDGDSENQEDEEEDGDGEHDYEDETQGGKEDESKSAIKWTEDDQKNLMDLGTLELERNQRLESLIARRRARRNMRLIAEKNLIDLDDVIPVNIPPISTSRHNPFDLPYDDVPGSAPSILLPRQNPFDLPYDSNEEKPDLKGDSFQQEFSSLESREPLFRRHESFTVGPSTLGGFKQGRHDLQWKPYFVPERFASEGARYPAFQRQSTTINFEDVEQVDRRDDIHDGVDITFGGIENHRETDSSLSASGGPSPVELIANEVLLRMGTGGEVDSSRSSVSSVSEIDEKISDLQTGSATFQPTSGLVEGSHITQTSLDNDFHFATGVADDNQHRQPVLETGDNDTRELSILQSSLDSDFQFRSGIAADDHHEESVQEPTGDPSDDSGILKHSSVESDWHFTSAVADSQEPALELKADHVVEPSISTQTSLKSNLHFADVVVPENQHKDPVYDSSPSSVEKFLSFSSISSDTLGEMSEMGAHQDFSEVSDNEFKVHSESMQTDKPHYDEKIDGSSQVHSEDQHETISREITEISKHDGPKCELSEVDPDCDGQNGFMKSELVVEHTSVDSPLSLPDSGVKVDVVCNEDSSVDKQEKLLAPSLDTEMVVGPNKDVIEKLDSASSAHQMASEEIDFPSLKEQHSPVTVGHVSAGTKLCPPEAQTVEERASVMEDIPELEKDQFHLLTSDADVKVNGSQVVDNTLDFTASSSEQMPSNGLNLNPYKERESEVLAEQVLEAYPGTSLEAKHVEDLSFRKEKTLRFQQEYMHPSNSDATIGDGLQSDIDVKVVSSESGHEHVPLEQKSILELQKQLSWSDKSIVELSFNTHKELQEPSVPSAGSAAETSTANNASLPEPYDSENTMLNKCISMTSDSSSSSSESLDYRTPYPEERSMAFMMSDSTSSSPMSAEYKSPPANEDMEADVFDKVVYEHSGHILEHPNYSTETHGSHVAMENATEVEDEIKEIDEGLLSELDTVGDFGVKEVVGPSTHDKEMPEDANCRSSELDFVPHDSEVTEIKPELPVLEVRSVEDIDLAFKQLHDGVDVDEVIVPSMFEDQELVVNESQHSVDTNSYMPSVEARSLEDIHIQQVSQMNREELSDSKDECAEVSEVSTTRELPVLAARNIENNDLDLKEQQGVDVEEAAFPSIIDQQQGLDELKAPGETGLDLSVIEARSSGDIPVAMQRAAEDNFPEMQPLDPIVKAEVEGEESESRTSQVTEIGSSKDMESSTSQGVAAGAKESESSSVDSDIRETSTITSPEIKQEFD